MTELRELVAEELGLPVDPRVSNMAAAIAAGTIRRAYLKGLGQAMGCTAPAAPQA